MKSCVRKKIPNFAQCDRTAGIIERFFITDFQFDVKKFKDIIRLTDGYDIQDAINSAYSNYSIEDTALFALIKERINTMNKLELKFSTKRIVIRRFSYGS
jgi:hypothetical protein